MSSFRVLGSTRSNAYRLSAACDVDLCFPTAVLGRRGKPGGKVQGYVNTVRRGFLPQQWRAAVTITPSLRRPSGRPYPDAAQVQIDRCK
jgi:hypothetical protein